MPGFFVSAGWASVLVTDDRSRQSRLGSGGLILAGVEDRLEELASK